MVRTANIRRHVPRRSGGGGGGTSVKTPDGLTTITRKRHFDPYDYGASGKRSQWFAKWATVTGTTTVSVRTSGDGAQTHDLEVGNGVALVGAGAATSIVGTPPITGNNASVTLGGVAITFTITDDANDIITTSSEMPAVTADPVRVSNSGGALPTGLAAATTYYVRKLTTAGTTWTFHPTANDATNNTAKIAITGGSGTHTIIGYTEHNHTVVCVDGNNGHSPPSAAIQSFGWNIPSGWVAHYRKIKVPVLWGTASVVIYGRGTSGRTALIHLDTVIPFRDGADSWISSFSGISTASAGAASQLTGISGLGHGLAVGDFVNIRCTSSGDTGYDVRAEVTVSNANDITIDHPFQGSGTASGYIKRGTLEWRDYGDRPTLDPVRYCPSVPNATLSWKASTAYCQGQRAIDSSGRWWRVARVVGGWMSGSSAPSWTATPNTYVVDNEVTWIRDWFDIPVAEPTVAGNQTLLTEVASVPSADTFTTVVAATLDNATNALKLSHNAAKAFRDAMAALKTYGRAGVFKISAGEHIIHLPKQTNSTYWTKVGEGLVNDFHFLFLNSGTLHIAEPKISIIADPSATVYVRMMQNGQLVEDLIAGVTNIVGNVNFITQAVDNTTIQGGTYEWGPAGGGFTEWDNISVSYAQSANWFATGQSGWSQNPATTPQKYLIDNVTVHWPTIATQTGGITSSLDARRRVQGTWRDCYLFYGGGDGDQTFLPWGDFKWRGGQIRQNRLYGSHGFYLGIVTTNINISDVDIINVSKNAVQMRGSGNDTELKEVRLTNVRAINSGPFLIGDTTSSNRVHEVYLVNCRGSIRMAEARNVQVKGGTYTTINMVEDCQDIDLEGFVCDTLELANTIDVNKNIRARGITFRQYANFSNCEDSWMTDCYCTDPYEKVTALCTGTYAWTVVGGTTSHYQLSKRFTPSGDPGIAAPAGVSIRGRLNIASKANRTLTGDDYYYGNPEVQTLTITGSPTTGTWTASYNGAGPTSGIALGATAATVQTALRTLTGLSLVTVTQTGSGNNLTYHVCMTGVVGDPPQMTVAHTFNQGTITPATSNPYPGYDTLVVYMGDGWRPDPDENPNDTIYTVAFNAGLLGLACQGSVRNFTFNNVQVTNTLDQTHALVFFGLPQFYQYRNIQFNDCKFRKTGLAATTTMYMVDFGQNSALAWDNIEFNNCLFSVSGNTTALRVPVRFTMAYGGKVTFKDCKFPGFTSCGIFNYGKGCVDMIRCDVQSNEVLVITDATNDAWNIASGSVDMSTGPVYYPVQLYLDSGGSPPMTLPVTSPQIDTTTTYWMRTDNNKLFTTEANASANTSPIDITTDAVTLTMKVLNAARTDLLTSNEWTGGLDYFDVFNRMEGNTWRGQSAATYPQIATNQTALQLQPIVNVHRLNTDNNGGAGRDIQGLDAPGAGCAAWEREDSIINVGSYPIVLKHDSASAASLQDRLVLPAATDVSIPVNGEVKLRWDPIVQRRRLVSKNF